MRHPIIRVCETRPVWLGLMPRHLTVLLIAAALAGCASTAVKDNFSQVQSFSRQKLGAELQWLNSDEARRQAQAETERILSKPLGGDDAVRIALAYSPSLQAMLYESAAQTALAVQSARLPNPVFEFERMVRREDGARDLDMAAR